MRVTELGRKRENCQEGRRRRREKRRKGVREERREEERKGKLQETICTSPKEFRYQNLKQHSESQSIKMYFAGRDDLGSGRNYYDFKRPYWIRLQEGGSGQSEAFCYSQNFQNIVSSILGKRNPACALRDKGPHELPNSTQGTWDFSTFSNGFQKWCKIRATQARTKNKLPYTLYPLPLAVTSSFICRNGPCRSPLQTLVSLLHVVLW